MSSKRETSDGGSASNKRPKVQSSMRNFFGGTGVIDLTEDDNATAKTSEQINEPNLKPKLSQKYKIYCDLDGVLVDFAAGVRKLNRGKEPEDLPPHILWGSIARANRFFESAPWTKDGKELWHFLVKNSALMGNKEETKIQSLDILTGVPSNFQYRKQKFNWCRRELQFAFDQGSDSDRTNSDSDSESNAGAINVTFNHVDMAAKKKQHERVSGSKLRFISTTKHNTAVASTSTSTSASTSTSSASSSICTGLNVNINIITCWSKNKHRESRRGCVLIDDRKDLGIEWTKAGGVFIHHTDASSSIAKLQSEGIIQSK